jgi:hypothetical protein
MIGNLFYHGVSPTEIKAMAWHEMKYWNSWVELMEKEKTVTPRVG